MKEKMRVHTQILPPTIIGGEKLKRFPLVAGLLFVLLAWGLLNVFEHEFLFRVQELSLWLPTKVYFDERMMVPAGMMDYISCFLTQFFYYPLLGSFIYVVLLLAVQWMTMKVFNIPVRHALLALIPGVLILCCSMEVGYWIFQIKTQGYFYSALVGFLSVLSAMRFYQMSRGWLKFLVVIAIAVVGYPISGFYALLSLLGIALCVLKSESENRKLLALICVVFVVVTPVLYYGVYEQTRFGRMFTIGMPAFDFSLRDFRVWTPYILLYLFPLVMVFISFERGDSGVLKKRFLLEMAGESILLFALIALFWYRDPNFRAEIKMNHAMERLEWRKALDIAKAQKQTPTRLIVLNKNLALLKLGKAGDEMFHYLDGGEAPATPLQIRLMQVGGKMLYYHYARMNFCYRWCLEDAVEYGWKVDYLKYMVRTSLISGEPALAQKYINTLKKTLFYRGWAKKYEEMVNDPTLIAKDREMACILPLYQYEDQLDGDNSLVEIYLLNYFAHTYNDFSTPMFNEAALMCALTLKDIPTFWNCFFRYANSHKADRMPTHYQEAALLYGNLEKNVDISKMPFDKAVKMRFQDFMRFAQKHAVENVERDPVAKKLFYDRFGNTFWYFYFFIRDVKSY